MTAYYLHLFTQALQHWHQPTLLWKVRQSSWVKALRLWGGIGFALWIGGCSSIAHPERSAWEQYENERYDFAFPYPDTWVSGPLSNNLDGQEFRDPRLDEVSMRGWASQSSETDPGSPDQAPDHEILPNFTTEQGIEGRLRVVIGSEMSHMQLTLVREGVVYAWEGRSPSDEFDDYFKFFFYVAKQYRIEEDR